ncbi:hypothetical protein [Anaeromassilibacillus sp. An250]|uniref:hypothetical protein n=1 Tax=Anaeromassilibacillus sp. An250 TaxID=1965604 RepID=UPI000B397553|nr:hypothetical protein [Anaeromassilibacillus sp. An250]OUO74081.1 hypothetical protein B5F54_08740 [Anaeromassilibacillus sp. An250]
MKKNLKTYSRQKELSIAVYLEKKQVVCVKGNVNGEISVIGEDGKPLPITSVIFKHKRDRKASVKKGDKILCYFPTPGKIANFSLNENIASFDAVYAVDTNTKQIGDIWYSRGAVAKLEKFEKISNNSYNYEVTSFCDISSENSFNKYQMEQAVWNKAISQIQEHEGREAKIALVVDCDLENIDQYNNRTMKIRDDKFLPDNFTLVYASADNSDSILNVMIKFCDNRSKELLKIKCDILRTLLHKDI